MNGARSTFKRRGYLLTALAAAVLLAASPGTASAQGQSVGFTASSGSVAEAASHEAGALEPAHRITIRATGVPAVAAQRTAMLDAVILNVSASIRYAIVNPLTGQPPAAQAGAAGAITVGAANFNRNNEAVLLVTQGGADGSVEAGQDNNWRNEQIRFTLSAGTGVEVSPATYTLTVNDADVAPVARFTAPSFTLTEGSEREVSLDIVNGATGRPGNLPGATAAGISTNNDPIVVSVSNHSMVTIGAAGTPGAGIADCPTAACGDRKAVHLSLGAAWAAPDSAAFRRTARLSTGASGTGAIADLAGDALAADITVKACDVAGFRNQQVTLTILPNNLVEPAAPASARVRGDYSIGSPLTITVDSNEAAPTLSFSPTDVTIDEGGSTSTRLIADGASATEVGMVKLMVEGHAMVDLYHEDTKLEEMNGYVTVDMGMNNSARLTAMSMSDPELMDGETKYKAWKLMEGSSDAAIGDDYWFRVDVMGSTAVPALPLIGQLLLALFLMAGGSRLYRRRNG